MTTLATAADFTATFSVGQTPKEVFDAINNVRGWWSEEIDGRTDALDAVFLYHYQDKHICKMKIVEFVPGKTVVWLVMNNYFNFVKDENEWNDTKIRFEISENGDQTQLSFTHEGLVPQYECFDVCRKAWSGYITNSLRDLITAGKGQPNPKEAGNSFYTRLVEKWNSK